MFRNAILQRTTSAMVLVAFTSMSFASLAQAQSVAVASLRGASSGFSPPQGTSRLTPSKPATTSDSLASALATLHDELKVALPPASLSNKGAFSLTAKKSGQDISELTRRVVAIHEKLGPLFASVEDDFEKTGLRLRDAGATSDIIARHAKAVATYREKMADFERHLVALKTSPSGSSEQLQVLELLGSFLSNFPAAKRHNFADPTKLPFGTPNRKVRAPLTSREQFQASIFPQQFAPIMLAGPIPTGTSFVATSLPPLPVPADTAENEEVRVTPSIKEQVAALENSPVKIFNWVRNNIGYLPTYGSVQGSDMTLASRHGNAFDTATLLIAMYRAAGIPARYVYGTIEVPADAAMNWMGGMTKIEAVQSILSQGGVPNIGVLSGGVVKTLRMEHVWVEAFVDFTPSRGAKNRTPQTWVAIDPSFKQFREVPALIPKELTAGIGSAAVSYMNSAIVGADGSRTGYDTKLVLSRVAAISDQITSILAANPGKMTIEEAIGGRNIIVNEPSILMGTLPYRVVAQAEKFSVLPANLRVVANIELFTASPGGEEGSLILSKTLSLPKIAYGSLNLTHVPATASDAAVIDSYTKAGSESFPPYLVRFKPQLSLDGVIMASGDGIQAGEDVILRVTLAGAVADNPITFNITAGDEIEVGINGAGQAPSQGFALKDRKDLGTAAGNLYAASKVYWTKLDFQDQVMARLQGVVAARLPSAGIFSSPLSVTYNFGIPMKGSYHSRAVDVKSSAISAVALDGNQLTTSAFVMHSGMFGSSTEGSALEETFAKPIGKSSTTMRMLELANAQQIPIYRVNSANLVQLQTRLHHSPEVMADLNNSVNAGLEVIIPEHTQANGTWVGSGYIMIDPATGSADYRVSGGLSGAFSDEECQRATQPVRVAVPDIAGIWWVLFGWMVDDDFELNGATVALAIVGCIAVIAIIGFIALPAGAAATAVAAGATEVAILTRGAFAAIALLASSNAAAEAGGEDCDCIAVGVIRRGGESKYTLRHNEIADRYTDIAYKGRDVRVRGIHFDGLKTLEFPPQGRLYEVKTGKFYSVVASFPNQTPSKKKFLELLKAKAVVGYFRERVPASFCAYDFKYGATDAKLIGDMAEFFQESGVGIEAGQLFVIP